MLSYEEFKRRFRFGNFLHKYQINVIDQYVIQRVIQRDWALCQDIFERLLKSADERIFLNALYDMCRDKLEHEDNETDRFADEKKLQFFHSLKNTLRQIKKIGERESGLNHGEVVDVIRKLKRIYKTQKKYYREKDGSPIVFLNGWIEDASNAKPPEEFRVTTKADLVLLLFSLNAIKTRKHPSATDRESVARFFLFWNFEKEGKEYNENPSEYRKKENDVFVTNVADRFKERYKSSLPFEIIPYEDPDENRVKVRVGKPIK